MPDLSVADNISIATPPRRFGMIDAQAQRRRAEALLAEVGCEDINPLHARARPAAVAPPDGRDRQGARPASRSFSSSTRRPRRSTSADVEKVYAMLARLQGAEGVAILYISHRMHEIEALADRASVFRNGRHIETFDKGARSTARDRAADDRPRHRDANIPPKPKRAARRSAALEAREPGLGEPARRHLARRRRGRDRRPRRPRRPGPEELLLALFGVLRGVTGEIRVDGGRCGPARPAAAKRATVGIALVPEDRKTEGLMLPMSIADNLDDRLARHALARPRSSIARQGSARGRERHRRAADQDRRQHRRRCRRSRAATSRRSSSPNG